MKKHHKDSSLHVPQRDKLKGKLNLKPLNWTEKQKSFFDIALNKDSKITFVSGPAGSSKTVLAAFAALQLLNDKRVSDIYYIRSAVESADNKLGYLPGEVEDKMSYYGFPFLDKLDELLGKNDVDALTKEGRISIFPVNYIRGLSWNAKAIIVDEAQNMTQKELITVLTRLGRFSKCFVLADPMQSDINGKSGGFTNITKLFMDKEAESNGIYNFEFTEDDIMRSELVKFLVKRFNYLNKPK
jgi:phosphate starvation-inducible PhoH-like protein